MKVKLFKAKHESVALGESGDNYPRGVSWNYPFPPSNMQAVHLFDAILELPIAPFLKPNFPRSPAPRLLLFPLPVPSF